MMTNINIINKLSAKAKRISPSVRVLDKASEISDLVLEKEAKYAAMSDLELKNLSYRMMDEIAKGIPLENFLVDGLAIAREIIFRVHKLKAYKVQIIGAIVAHFGDFAEMKTGEGKTLTLLLVSYVNALSKKGVHIVTVNEYLVKRDMEFSSAALNELGVTVGYVTSEMNPDQKRSMYNCDITYISNSELGFDYLRDNMVHDYADKMQRGLNFAIVDEADSILIDEARTPLIIAGNPEEGAFLYTEVDIFVKQLVPNDYVIDLESHAINLNDNGIKKAEEYFKITNLYDIENSSIVHKMMNALRANYIMEIGKEYIIRYNAEKKHNEIALVDAFTGRIMEGRMYSSGLHQAIQAKENAHIDPENVTLATITYQSFFRLYKKLAGMSGTAMTEKQEFIDIYNMVVVEIPTNEPLIRDDQPDFVFGTKQLKWKYVVADIKRRHELGQPILVGTVSVEDSELLHRLLEHVGIKHKVLNAKNNTIEAEIIKGAGVKGAVTIATNMAGRGTDIKLGEGVIELGGLFVLGTERNESRRIDNQLRGRSGRQGDPGESRFFISLQDSLFKRFASDRFEKAQFKMGEDVIDLKFFSRLLDKTQKRVENMNYDMRKNLIDYDYVLSEQRELIYKQRNAVLNDPNLLSIVRKMIPRVVDVMITVNHDQENTDMVNVENLLADFENKLSVKLDLNVKGLKQLHNSEIFKILCAELNRVLTAKFNDGDKEANNKIWRSVIINCIDSNWTKFLDRIQKLRDGVSLRSYEQKSPLNIYVEDSDRLFYNIIINIAEETIKYIVEFATQNSYQRNTDATQLRFIDNAKLNPQMQGSNVSQHILDELGISPTRNQAPMPAKPILNESVRNTVEQIFELSQQNVNNPPSPVNVDTNIVNSFNENVLNIVDQLFNVKLDSKLSKQPSVIDITPTTTNATTSPEAETAIENNIPTINIKKRIPIESKPVSNNSINTEFTDEVLKSFDKNKIEIDPDLNQNDQDQPTDVIPIEQVHIEDVKNEHPKFDASTEVSPVSVTSTTDDNDFLSQIMNSVNAMDIQTIDSSEIANLVNSDKFGTLENFDFNLDDLEIDGLTGKIVDAPKKTASIKKPTATKKPTTTKTKQTATKKQTTTKKQAITKKPAVSNAKRPAAKKPTVSKKTAIKKSSNN